jgi:PEP-CTERM motif
MRNTRTWSGAVAVLIFVAALVTFAPAARADSNTDIYSATYTCQESCALVPTSPDGDFFKPNGDFQMDFDGADLIYSIVFSLPEFKPTDSYSYIVNDGDLTRDHITVFFFTLTDLNNGDQTGHGFLFPGELLAPTFSEGIVSFTDVTAAQKAPEPGSVALLALGLGLLVWFGKNRTAVYQLGAMR